MFLVDSHCHLNDLNYKKIHKNVLDVIHKANNFNVKIILAVCNKLTDLECLIKKCNNINNIYFSCGVHPLNINKTYNFNKLSNLSKKNNVIAIGETGLDYYYSNKDYSKQQFVFREHIKLGCILNKPLIIHTRNSYSDTLRILNEENATKCGGVFHCFNESYIELNKLLELGFYASFSGIITFNKVNYLLDAVRYIPLNRILLETDSPYLTPVPYRGTENQPAYLYEIAKFIAKIKKISLIELAQITTNNFKKLFKINKIN